MARRNVGEKREESVAVAIDKDKGSQYALKWAVDHLLSKGQSITLVHVKTKPSSIPTSSGSQVNISDVNGDVAKAYRNQIDSQAREVFLPFRCFCSRKDIKCAEVILEDTDISKALIDFVSMYSIEVMVLGTPSRGGFVKRFRTTDVPTNVSKGAPEYCTVYVIGKGKILSVRSASALPPPKARSPSDHLRNQPNHNIPEQAEAPSYNSRHKAVPDYWPQSPYKGVADRPQSPYNRPQSPYNRPQSPYSAPRTPNRNQFEDMELIRSPFTRPGRIPIKYESSVPDSDISFVSSGRPSTDRLSYDNNDFLFTPPRLSASSDFDASFTSSVSANRSQEFSSQQDFSSTSLESGMTSWSSSQNVDDVEAEMRRLRQELKQTMDMYSAACKEALTAKQRAKELHSWKLQEQQRIEEARLSEEAALSLAEKEKAKCKAAMETAHAAQHIAELEAQKRMNAEMRANQDADEGKMAVSSLMYRKYTIEEIETATEEFSNSRKIGEGGYGPVYHGELDHTPVAIKVLRPDAAQGQSQFQKEIEVLSCIRHPNMVLLLGACPQYGCLVYEYMANGSLEDRLFRRNNSPVLPWQVRFRIAAEIATGLLFLHQTKPEPLVHRDLKPANILLDRNYVSKISDVGLARLVPPSVANSVTQYRMTSTAGTFCYIDPEYQQTGMLGTKSDIYSLGILLLQIITARPAMGLTHHVEHAIENGTFSRILDPAVPDWPVEEALIFAKLALKCAELRRKDRPDLGKVIFPELNRLRNISEDSMSFIMLGGSTGPSPRQSQVSASSIPDSISDPLSVHSGYDSSHSCSRSSFTGRQ